MICVTGSERSAAALVARLEAQVDADLQEIRLDLLDRPAAVDPGDLPGRDRLIVTCRSAAEGGRFAGSDEERHALLERALRAGVRYVDLEAAAPDALWRRLAAAPGAHRLVASLHRLSTPSEAPAALLRRLEDRPAATLKLAVAVDDVADLAPLRALRPADGRPLLRLGLGPAGQVSRVRWRAMGSPWTYAFAPGGAATAPGQIDAPAIRRAAAARQLLVLIGGDSVHASPGPRVYNQLAAAQDLDAVYVATPTSRPLEAIALLTDLGLTGASVTMPHKEALLRLATSRDEATAAMGALNTLQLAGEGWRGFNTDGIGVLCALGPHLGQGPRRVLLLGAGGAARAAGWALGRAGHLVTVAGRSAAKTEALARQHGIAAARWNEAADQDFEVVVNATPVGSDGEANPLSGVTRWRGRVALDLLLRPTWTPLLRAVQKGGGTAVTGLEMWTHQGAAQWEILTGKKTTAATLLRLAGGIGPCPG